jgi:hypothetical protein
MMGDAVRLRPVRLDWFRLATSKKKSQDVESLRLNSCLGVIEVCVVCREFTVVDGSCSNTVTR